MIKRSYPLIDIKEFLPRLNLSLQTFDSDALVAYISDSIKQFCKDAKVLREIVCIKLDCFDSYILELPRELMVSEVLNVRWFGDCGRIVDYDGYELRDNVFYITDIDFIGQFAGTAEIEVSLEPKRDALEVPAVLYEQYVEPITYGTLAKVLLLPSESHNPQLATYYQQQYNKAVNRCIIDKYTKHKAFNIKLRNNV